MRGNEENRVELEQIMQSKSVLVLAGYSWRMILIHLSLPFFLIPRSCLFHYHFNLSFHPFFPRSPCPSHQADSYAQSTSSLFLINVHLDYFQRLHQPYPEHSVHAVLVVIRHGFCRHFVAFSAL